MRKSLLILLLSLMTLNSNAQMMKLGDLNHDNQVNITDIMTLVDIVMNGYSPFDVSPTEISMKAGATALLTIEGGYYYYEVESANPDVVTASLNDLTVTLTAIAGGETYVTVKDVLTFRNIIIPVVVEHNELQVSTNSLSLLPGQQGTVEINSGSGYYSVQSSDESVATADIVESSVVVNAVGGGTSTITVTDTKSGQMKVIEVSVEYIPFALSKTILYLYIGEKGRVDITSGNGIYDVLSSDESVATADVDGSTVVVTAAGYGTANITVKDTKSEQTGSIEVTVSEAPVSYFSCPNDHHPHLIDLGLPSGTKWACCNVDATTPEGYGGYYAWGETEEKDIYTHVTYSYAYGVDNDGDGFFDDFHELDVPGFWMFICSDIAGTTYDVAHVKWGGSWVMPSAAQIAELFDNCNYSWIFLNNVYGIKMTSKKNDGNIFLPAAGYRWKDLLVEDVMRGTYWSSTQEQLDARGACAIDFMREFADMEFGYAGLGYFSCGDTSLGFTVRPVSR